MDSLAGHADSGILSEDLTDVMVAVGEAARACTWQSTRLSTYPRLNWLLSSRHPSDDTTEPAGVLVGAGLPQLPRLVGEAKSYSERLFEFPVANSLVASDAAEAIVRPAPSSSLRPST